MIEKKDQRLALTPFNAFPLKQNHFVRHVQVYCMYLPHKKTGYHDLLAMRTIQRLQLVVMFEHFIILISMLLRYGYFGTMYDLSI